MSSEDPAEGDEQVRAGSITLSRSMTIVATFGLIVLLVVSLAGAYRADTLQDSVNKLEDQQEQTSVAAKEARDAAKKASDDLTKAIEESQGGAIDPELIATSLNASIKAECILDREYNNPERVCP